MLDRGRGRQRNTKQTVKPLNAPQNADSRRTRPKDWRKQEGKRKLAEMNNPDPGAFKLDHLQPVKPILLHKFSNLFTFILGAKCYYPRKWKVESEKMEFSQPEWERGISVPGAFKLDHFWPVEPILLPKFSNFFTFIVGANSYYPREGKAEKGKMEFSHP